MIGSSLAALVTAPRAPTNVRIPTSLSYDTQVSWNASTDADVAGYEVVWRDSIEPLWTHSREVGNVTTATIENLNKDNFQGRRPRGRPRRQPQPRRDALTPGDEGRPES